MYQPHFDFTIGSFSANSSHPVAGVRGIVVDRDMQIPADCALIYFSQPPAIQLGDDCSIELGYADDLHPVFTGTVARVLAAINGTIVTALGPMNALLSLYNSATYQDQTAGDIARALIREADLQAGTIDDGPTLPRYAIDRRLSAYAHLRDLAERLGFELYSDAQGAIMFHGLGAAAQLDAGGLLGGAMAALTEGGEGYHYGQHVIAARATGKSAPWGSVTVSGESPMSSEGDNTADWLTTNTSDYVGHAGSGQPMIYQLDPAARTKDLADRFAAGRLATAQRSSNQIEMRILGRAQLALGGTISQDEFSDALLNKSGYVRAIRHRFLFESGFTSDLRVCVSEAV